MSEIPKFKVVVGNPPYQIKTREINSEGVGDSANIFQLFQIIANSYSIQSVLIYPAGRWIRRTGKGLKNFGLEQINNPHLKEVIFIHGSEVKTIFPAAIGDGVSIVDIDKNYNSDSFLFNNEKIEKPGDKIMPLWKNLHSLIEKLEKYPNVAMFEANKKRVKFDMTVADQRDDAFLVYDYPVPPDCLKNPIKVGLNNTTGKKGRTAIYWTEDTITENKELLEKNSRYRQL